MVLAGCTSTNTRTIQPDRPLELSKLSIPPDEKVRITLADGRQLTVINFQVKPDSACWYNLSTTKIECVATRELSQITHIDYKKGKKEGRGAGILGE